MKKKNPEKTKKLNLVTQTVRQLTQVDLKAAVGGGTAGTGTMCPKTTTEAA